MTQTQQDGIWTAIREGSEARINSYSEELNKNISAWKMQRNSKQGVGRATAGSGTGRMQFGMNVRHSVPYNEVLEIWATV